jgi:hypothetical protein
MQIATPGAPRGTSARRRLLLVATIAVLALARLASAAGQSPQPLGSIGRPNTWSATSNNGRTFAGTWTAKIDPATGTVSGTWTLIDAGGKTVMGGGWSAAKSKTGWSGSWRAVVSGRQGEYSGTWTADLDLPPNVPFSQLFERAASAVVSGRWRAGRYFGAWSIRAFSAVGPS